MTDKTFLQRFQDARVELQNMELKKSGKVKFKQVNFTYYELADFLPAVNLICQKHSLVTKFSIDPTEHEKAVLTILDALSDSPRSIVFTSSTAESTSLGDGLKNLGGKITYMRRYMLMTAFEMVESDNVEKIVKELTDQLSAEDIAKIEKSKDFEELTKVCGALKKTYKAKLIKPYFDERKEELEDKVVKKEK